METLARAANRGSVSTGYDIDNSLKFESDNSEYLYRTPSSATNRQTWTWSGWVKRTELGTWQMLFSAGNGSTTRTYLSFSGSDVDRLTLNSINSSIDFYVITDQVFRDTSAWYHIVVAVDTTDGTQANRVKMYVNGNQVSTTLQSGSLTQNVNTFINSTEQHVVSGNYNGVEPFNGYMAEVNFVDGSQLAPTDFGEFDSDTGIWKPKAYTGSYGTNGFYLDFESSGSLGADASGNSNNFSLQNVTSADQATDTPTNNFATLNPLVTYYGSATINEGATKIQGTSTSSFETVYSTIAVTSGKWYFEVVNLLGSTRNTSFGIVNLDTAVFDGTTYNSAGFWLGNMDTGGQIYYYENGVATGSEYITFSQGDIIGLAFDADNGTLDFYINNSNQEQFTGIPSGTFAFLVEVQGTGAPYIQTNFGGYTVIPISSAASDANGYGNFEYAPPSGYYALCSKNLAQYG